MTSYTPLLHLPEVASNQDQKEATINTAIAILEAAMNDTLVVSLASGDVTLNTDQFTKYFHHQFSGNTVARTVSIPNTPRWFAVENLGSASITFEVTGAPGLTAELASGKIGLVVSDGTDVRFVVPDPTGGVGLLEDLSNVSGVPTDHQLLRYVAADSSWEPWTLVLAFSQLTDFPGAYVSNATKLLAVKADGSGLEWVSSAANVNSFIDLNDVPNSYSGAANKTVKVNSGATGLIFATPKLTEASDFPANYTSAAGKFARVNSTPNALIFDNVHVVDLLDGPGAPTAPNALKYVRINAAGTALEYGSGTGGPDHFFQLADVPGSYTSQANKLVRVKADETGLDFRTLKFTELSDAPTAYTGAALKFVQVNSGGTALVFNQPKVADLSDGPGVFTSNAKKVVRVNAGATALEYVALALTDLVGFPTTFTGQGGKFLQVKLDESGVQFSTSSFTTNFLALTDTPSSYTSQAGKMVVVDPTATGLIFVPQPAVPTRLGQLADVEDGTGTPVQGAFLRWIDGVWQADVFTPGSSGSATFAGLTDGPGALTGHALQYVRVNAATSHLEYVTLPMIPTLLGQLADVEDGTGTPAENSVLTWKNGVWQAEPSTGGGSATLAGLSDVAFSAGPAGGQILRFDATAAKWENEYASGLDLQVEGGYHTYWRIKVIAGQTTDCAFAEIQLRSFSGGGEFEHDAFATALAGNTLSGSAAANAFDTNNATVWRSNAIDANTYIGLHTAHKFKLRAVQIRDLPGGAARPPKDFDVQYSDDGTTWATSWRVRGHTWNAGGTDVTLFDQPTPNVLLGNLGDVDLPGGDPADGDVLTWTSAGGPGLSWTNTTPLSRFTQLLDSPGGYAGEGGHFVVADDGENNLAYSLGTVHQFETFADHGPHPYWRLHIRGAAAGVDVVSFSVGVAELEFRAIPGGANQVAGGTPLGSTAHTGSDISFAFDGDTETAWNADGLIDGTTTYNIGYHFPTDVVVQEVAITSPPADWPDSNAFGPDDFDVQYSNDGTTWTTAWTGFATGSTGRGAGTYTSRDTPTASGLTLRGLIDAPHSYVGQAHKVVAVRADETGVEFVAPATGGSSNVEFLGDLADVEAGTGTPVQGAFLRYIDGVWQADTPDLATRATIDIIISKNGLLFNSQVLATIPLTRAIWFQDDFAGSKFHCKTNPAATTVISVLKNGTQIGTVSISTSGVATFSTIASGEEAFVAGDTLRIDGPSSADATLADFGITFAAQRAA